MPSWPPLWAWIGVRENRNPEGEVGILKAVVPDSESPRCFLTIEYENDLYMGCVFVQDASFSRELAGLLELYLGHKIEQIAALDVSSTFYDASR
jgi:hypothetical protein